MNRARLQQLAEDRLIDAAALLAAGRWSAAYYLTGYAVECGLKSCVLRHLDDTGRIFSDADYLKSLSGCWTHDFSKLLRLAGLEAEFGKACGAAPALKAFWEEVALWTEVSRYRDTDDTAARRLFEAVTHNPSGVLTWIRTRW